MNDAYYISSPAKTNQTVDNSLKPYVSKMRVIVLEKNDIFSLNVMWNAFIRQTSQDVVKLNKHSKNPQIFSYASCYGTPIQFYEGEEGVDLAAGTTLGYDADGNLTSYGAKAYAWDYRNRMASSTESGSTTVYKYDHANQRVKRTHGSTTTIYPNQYYSLEGATSTKYIWAGDELVGYIEGNGAATSTYYVHSDHLGSTNAVTDSTGATSLSKDYYPYGSSRISSGDADLARGYIGQFQDSDDLSYLQNRYYSSDRGQFLSQDPVHLAVGDPARLQNIVGQKQDYFLSDPQLFNSYGYGRGNPIRYSDPTGNIAPAAVPFILFAIGGLLDTGATYYVDVMQNQAQGNPVLDPFL